jgi:hypothetical protein
MTQRNLFSILGILVLIGSCLWFFSRSISHAPVVVSTGTGLVSDLVSPFGSGDSSKTLFDTTPTQPTWETSSGATVYYNTNWMGRTVEIRGKPVYYQFGSGNPVETDRTSATMLDMQRYCASTTDPKCQIEQLSDKEIVGTSMNNEVWTPTDTPSRVTPELERLLYEFLSNPILRQSSESCGNKFFTYDQAYSVFGSTIGETQAQDWWNPYNIDINTYITINTNTGRKELNMMPMYTLRHQLNIPSELVGGTWWSNIPLRDCLQKNKQLTFLLSHVNLYTDKLQKEYRS